MFNRVHPVIRRSLPLVALILFLFFAWRWFVQKPELPLAEQPSKSASAGFHPTKEQLAGLKVAEVKLMEFHSKVNADGNLAFNEDALTSVFSPYSGHVTRLIAKSGDVVKKGAPLMAMDASEFVQGQSDVISAKASVDAARATEMRQHDLFDAGAGAQKDWRQAQADLASTQATYAAARGRLHILGKTDAEIDLIEKGATASTEAVVTAPISGTVTQRQVGLGQYIASASAGGGNPVFTIGDLSSVWLVANVRESDAPFISIGQPAEVTVLAFPRKTFSAKISWVASAVDSVTHRLSVRAEVKNPGAELKAQMFATFSISTGEAASAPAVPDSAMVYEGETAHIFVVKADGSIEVRSVIVGRHQNGMIEITDGLRAGEKVVTKGTLFVDRAAAGN